MTPNDPWIDVMLGYRPRSAWDNLTPEQRAVVGPNPIADPLGDDVRKALGLPSWRSQPMDYITPDQKTQVLQYLGRAAMTSAGAVGDALDKTFGGRALRGVGGAILSGLDPYGGHKGSWREALSLIPFSDTLGITRPEDKVSGKEMWGIKNDPNSYWDDVLGIGTEVLMDPSLFIGGFLKGGLTAGGKALKAAGALKDVDWAMKGLRSVRDMRLLAKGDEALNIGKFVGRRMGSLGDALNALPDRAMAREIEANLLRQANGQRSVVAEWMRNPIGTSLDIGVPFSESMRFGFNVPYLDKVRDKVFGKIASNPVVRGIKSQFYAPAKGMMTAIGQGVAEQVTHSQGRVPEYLEQILGEARRLQEAGEWTPQHTRDLYSALEGFTTGGSRSPVAEELAQHIRDQVGRERGRYGFGPDMKDEFVQQYVPRYGYRGEDKAAKAAATQFPVLNGAGLEAARSQALKNIDGGTATIMDMMMDDTIQNASKAKNWSKALDPLLTDPNGWGRFLPRHLQDPVLMDELKRILHATPKDVMKKGFFMHPLEAMYEYLPKHTDKLAVADAQIQMIAQGAVEVLRKGFKGETATFESMFSRRPMGDNWIRKSWMAPHGTLAKDVNTAAKTAMKNPFAGGAYAEFIQRYGTPGQKSQLAQIVQDWDSAVASLDQAGMEAAQDAGVDFLKDKIGSIKVPKEVMDDVVHWDNMFQPGKQISQLTQWFDKFTNLFKMGVLTWPARYVRDVVSGQAQNILLNQWSMGTFRDALQFVRKGVLDNPKQYLTHIPQAKLTAMTDEQAMKALYAHLAATGMLGAQHSSMSQIGNTAYGASKLADDLLNMPGPRSQGPLMAAAKELKGLGTKAGINPLNIRGVRGEETQFAMLKAGDILGQASDNLNRLVPYLTLKKRGVATNEALQRVMSSQVDYSTKTLTATERNIMTRLFPFWRYSSKMVPFTIQELLNRPGGAMAQAMRVGGKVGVGEDDFIPEHLRQNIAIPLSGALGSRDPERQRFLTGLGLMHEDPLSLYQPAGTFSGTIQNTLQDLLGRANPLLKAPAEMAFRQQLFSGRDLLDLDSNLGRIAQNIGNLAGMELGDTPPRIPLWVDQFASASPASRLLTTLRTLTDPAKGAGAKALNLLTGARLSDTNLEKARSVSINEAVEAILRGKPGVRSLRPHLYVREEDREKLNPVDLLLLDLYRQQLAEAKRAAMRKTKYKTLQDALQSARTVSELETDRRLF